MHKLILMAVLALSCPLLSHAEETVPSKFYKLDFLVQEVDGSKIFNSRSYSATHAVGGETCLLRTSSQIRVAIHPTAGSTSFQQYEIGVDIDITKMNEIESGLVLSIVSSISSMPAELEPTADPILRKNSWNATVLVPIRKQTVIFSSDDVSSKHKIQLVLTATPLK